MLMTLVILLALGLLAQALTFAVMKLEFMEVKQIIREGRPADETDQDPR